jgi:hypothetical protein
MCRTESLRMRHVAGRRFCLVATAAMKPRLPLPAGQQPRWRTGRRCPPAVMTAAIAAPRESLRKSQNGSAYGTPVSLAKRASRRRRDLSAFARIAERRRRSPSTSARLKGRWASSRRRRGHHRPPHVPERSQMARPAAAAELRGVQGAGDLPRYVSADLIDQDTARNCSSRVSARSWARNRDPHA